MDKDLITIALPKGRLYADCIRFFSLAGLPVPDDPESTRRLLFSSADGSVRFLMVRDKDLPTYVDYGAADLGVVGKDVLMEAQRDLPEPLDLLFGECRIVVAEPVASARKENPEWWKTSRIATKYPNITTRHFTSRGEQVEVIPLYGSVELAPLVGLADRIVDLVSTGETMKENNLVEVEEIAKVTARLVVNRASLKIREKMIVPLIEQARDFLESAQP